MLTSQLYFITKFHWEKTFFPSEISYMLRVKHGNISIFRVVLPDSNEQIPGKAACAPMTACERLLRKLEEDFTLRIWGKIPVIYADESPRKKGWKRDGSRQFYVEHSRMSMYQLHKK